MEEIRRLLDLANVIVYLGGSSRRVMERINFVKGGEGMVVPGQDGEPMPATVDSSGGTLEEALRYAQVLCKMGYAVLIVPGRDGPCHIFGERK